MEIADAEFRTGDVHGEECPTASTQVLDIAVPAVFRAAGDGSCSFLSYLLFELSGGGASMHVLGLRGLSDDSFEVGGGDEFAFTAVPFCEDFGAGGTA